VILSVIDYKEREKAIKISYQKKLQEANVENMEKLVKILRKTHHDIGNHLNKIFAIAQTEQKDTLDRIKDYISTLTDNIKSSFKSYNTGNSYLDGLLAVKNNEAKEKGIQLEVDFDAKLDILPISDQALISIVSNIVDNAFDAMENQVCDQKFISISGYIESSKYILSICNNGSVIAEQSLSKIFELGYSTKGNVSAYNGYGLYIAKQYVEENNGEIFVSSSDSDDETEFLMKFFLLNDDS
jgi:sensor histidine kinase regulating citrate/malate metabolism